MKIKILLMLAFIVASFAGCAKYTVSGGDQAVLREASALPMGVTYSKQAEAPKVDKFPIKVKNWSQLSREAREVLKPYVHTSGDYLPVEVKLELGNQGAQSENGFGGGVMVLKQVNHKNYGILITSWTDDADILLDIPVSGTCTVYRKTEIGQTGFDSSYIYQAMKLADKDAMVNVVKKLEENRAKIEKFYKEYQKSKEVF
jgi:hypothetical protein